ncbi:MAG: hypothetical protein PHS44_06680 [Candidatus Dojkabacteria bacterium]|nr:hypothetical protein [Candidatus Dojkabacteria bacterium]
MKVFGKIIIFVLLLIFVALLYLFVRTYRDIKYSEEYVDTVTTTANDILAEVEKINNELNTLEYDEDESDLTSVEASLEELKRLASEADDVREKYQDIYLSEGVDGSFIEFLTRTGNLISSCEAVVDSIENLEKKEDFDKKIESYIAESDNLELESTNLQNELNIYVENYSKFDMNRVLNEI